MQNDDSIEYAAKTDIGLKRTHNEDAIAVCRESSLTILADGMGGYNAGEVASEIAIKVVKEYVNEKLNREKLNHQKLNRYSIGLTHYSSNDLQQIVVQAIKLANNTIFNTALNVPQYAGMGTTLVVALSDGERLVVAHVGDSRAYRFRQGTLTQITRDHSIVQEQVDAGMITAESAQYSEIKNLVTRAVGVAYSVDIEIRTYQIEVEDVYMLCSDGLSDMLTAPKIQDTLQKMEMNLQEKCSELVKLANLNGGRDNISVILFRIKNIKTAGLEQLFKA